MVDILPYLYKRLRDADPSVRSEEQLTLLDVGGRTGVGSDLLASIFYGIWSKRKISVDVLDIDDTYEDYIYASARFVRQFICAYIFNMESDQYDYIVCSHVIEHIDEPFAFCEQLRRVSKRGVVMYCPYEEQDPIVGHNTITHEMIEGFGAQDITVLDNTWFWKQESRPELKTVLFWLPALT
ncbi:MAG: methyltransferase domain-containing protein [Pseudomonadota bacterium]